MSSESRRSEEEPTGKGARAVEEAARAAAGRGRSPGFLANALEGLAEGARATADEVSEAAAVYAGWVRETLEGGGTVWFCGNGGSAATAQHAASEYVVRFRRDRAPQASAALGTSVSELTAAANDFGYEQVFARGVRARARTGDLVVLHSTSGNSASVVRAAEAASAAGIRTVALTGPDGGELAGLADLCLAVPCRDVARVQELHLAIEHAVAERVDGWLADGDRTGDEPRTGEGRPR